MDDSVDDDEVVVVVGVEVDDVVDVDDVGCAGAPFVGVLCEIVEPSLLLPVWCSPASLAPALLESLDGITENDVDDCCECSCAERSSPDRE